MIFFVTSSSLALYGRPSMIFFAVALPIPFTLSRSSADALLMSIGSFLAEAFVSLFAGFSFVVWAREAGTWTRPAANSTAIRTAMSRVMAPPFLLCECNPLARIFPTGSSRSRSLVTVGKVEEREHPRSNHEGCQPSAGPVRPSILGPRRRQLSDANGIEQV